MDIFRVIVGELETNCYLLAAGNRCLVIDPGAEFERISAEIEGNGLLPVAVVLTHGHYDHIGAANQIAQTFGVKIFAHPEEIALLGDLTMNFSAFVGAPIKIDAVPLTKDFLPFDGFASVKILHLPGHTPGSIGLVGEDFFISGDTVFGGGGVGRTDLPGGDPKALAESIRKILSLEDSLVLYPGHGGRSVLRREKPLWRQAIKMLEDGLL